MTKLNTYFVLVNGKFMVKVETTGSACHAEHLILDSIDGTQTALAFDTQSMKTDTFIGAMMGATLTTLEDLTERFRTYAEQVVAVGNVRDAMHQIESEIDDLEHQLQAKREQADKISALHINAQAELNAIKCNLGIKNI